ncbi:unnamed protein product [Rhizoctonia solani]|uniref:Uncharacterized protein n=1 Tax=Rhizoctonia solani TaxID=456999 RepID=A0A8H3BHQ6_9AGAM|nr:unnamed protein product [Rhizoctonia solani]
MASEKTSSETTPVWCTGAEQTKVKLVDTDDTYSVDVDIAKRMGITQEGSEPESPYSLSGCNKQDFERALTFCAQDRACAEPPCPELAQIIQTTSPSSKPESEPKTDDIQISFANLTLTEDDQDDESYVPSEPDSSETDDEDEEELSETDMTDMGTANIQAEKEEYEAKQKQLASS